MERRIETLKTSLISSIGNGQEVEALAEEFAAIADSGSVCQSPELAELWFHSLAQLFDELPLREKLAQSLPLVSGIERVCSLAQQHDGVAVNFAQALATGLSLRDRNRVPISSPLREIIQAFRKELSTGIILNVAFSIAPRMAMSEETAKPYSWMMANFCHDARNHILIGSEGCVTALRCLHNVARTSSEVCRSWCFALSGLVWGSQEVRSNVVTVENTALLLDLQHAALQTSRSAEGWVGVVSDFFWKCAADSDVVQMLQVPEIVITITNTFELLRMDPYSIVVWLVSLRNIVAVDRGQQLLVEGVANLVRILADVEPAAKETENGVASWCQLIEDLARRDDMEARFGTVEFMMALADIATTEWIRPLKFWCSAVVNISCNNAPNKTLLGSSQMLEVFQAIGEHLEKEAELGDRWCWALVNLTAENVANQQLFSTMPIFLGLARAGLSTQSAQAAKRWCNCVAWLLPRVNTADPLFPAEKIVEGIIRTAEAVSGQPNPVSRWQSAVNAVINHFTDKSVVLPILDNAKLCEILPVDVKENLMIWVKNHYGAFGTAHAAHDRETVLSIVSHEGSALKFASPEMRASKKVVLSAVEQNGFALEYADEILQDDETVVISAVKQTGLALQYASDRLRGNQLVVLVAVANSGYALQFASLELQRDREIVLTAVKQNGHALKDADPELRNNKEVVLAAVAQDPTALTYAPEGLRGDEDVQRIIQQRAAFAEEEDDYY